MFGFLDTLSDEKKFALLETVLDKLLIALIVLLAAFLLNLILERSKQRFSFYEKLAVTRAEKVGEVWEHANRMMSHTYNLVRQASVILHAGLDKNTQQSKLLALKPLEQAWKEFSEKFEQVAEVNRYWTGEALYEKFREFHNLAHEYSSSLSGADLERLESARSKIEALRASVLKERPELLG